MCHSFHAEFRKCVSYARRSFPTQNLNVKIVIMCTSAWGVSKQENMKKGKTLQCYFVGLLNRLIVENKKPNMFFRMDN